jgi:membrane associated rhomboid family serine protease
MLYSIGHYTYNLITFNHFTTGIFGLYAHLSDVRIDLEWAEDAAWRRNHGRPYLSWSDFDTLRTKGVNNRPWFTYFLMFLCSVMLLVEFGLGNWTVAPISGNPMIGPSAQAMIDSGARVTPLIVEQGQWFRIFSPLFLHAGLVHYGINMAALWFVGGAIEQSHGIVNAMILFFIPGVGGAILSAIFLPQYISVGASGGIFGLIGGCIADITLNWNLLFMKTEGDGNETKRRNSMAVVWLLLDIFVNLLIGLTPYVDNFCHLGGLVYGICCGWSTIEPLQVGFFGAELSTWGRIRKVFVKFFGESFERARD